MSIFNKLKDKFKSFMYKVVDKAHYDQCYDHMEAKGDAVFGMCCGIAGGDSNSGNLCYDCISCPYLVPINK